MRLKPARKQRPSTDKVYLNDFEPLDGVIDQAFVDWLSTQHASSEVVAQARVAMAEQEASDKAPAK